MDIQRIREIIIEEINRIMEQPEDEKEKIDKDKEDIAKQKADIQQQKLDLSKQRFDHEEEKEEDREEAEQEKEKEKGEPGQKEPEKKPNISFKTQGKFYEDAYPELRNFVLSNGNLLDDAERNYVALAVQAAQGRVDKGFENFLRKGRAGNVYGKDFPDEDIQKLIKYCKDHELVR